MRRGHLQVSTEYNSPDIKMHISILLCVLIRFSVFFFLQQDVFFVVVEQHKFKKISWTCCMSRVVSLKFPCHVLRKDWSMRSKALRSGCQRYSNCWAIWRSSSTPSLVTTLIWRQKKAELWNGHWQLPHQGLIIFFSMQLLYHFHRVFAKHQVGQSGFARSAFSSHIQHSFLANKYYNTTKGEDLQMK